MTANESVFEAGGFRAVYERTAKRRWDIWVTLSKDARVEDGVEGVGRDSCYADLELRQVVVSCSKDVLNYKSQIHFPTFLNDSGGHFVHLINISNHQNKPFTSPLK